MFLFLAFEQSVTHCMLSAISYLLSAAVLHEEFPSRMVSGWIRWLRDGQSGLNPRHVDWRVLEPITTFTVQITYVSIC